MQLKKVAVLASVIVGMSAAVAQVTGGTPVQTQQSKTQSQTTTDTSSTGTSASRAATGSQTYTGSTTGSLSTSGGTTQSANGGQTQSATAIAGPAARADAYNQPIEQVQRGSLWVRPKWKADPGTALYRELYGSPQSSIMAKAASFADNPQALAAKQAAIKDQAVSQQAKAEKMKNNFKTEAEKRKKSADAKASQEIEAAGAGLN